MPGRRDNRDRQAPDWSRQKMLALLVGAAVVVVLLAGGLVLTVVSLLDSSGRNAGGNDTTRAGGGVRQDEAAGARATTIAPADPRDLLAAKPMPQLPESASHPAPVSAADPGPAITLPAATRTGAAGVPTGFPHTPAGALAQLAAIDQTALQSGSLSGARAVITGWAVPGGPTASSWSGVKAVADFDDAAGLPGGGDPQLGLVVTPLMGLIKGSLGSDFVVPCVDFEVDVTLAQTSRGAVADCERMAWTGHRWMVGAGSEPAVPPSVWPDTSAAIRVGYRDLRHG
jgi:hypothetical protein